MDGVDADPEQITRARAARRRRFDVGDALDLPVPDGVFELVACRALLRHLARPAGALREALRAARPGGALFVVEPILRPACWSEVGGDGDGAALRAWAEAALVAGARATGAGSWDVADRLCGLMGEAGWTGATMVRVEVVVPPEELDGPTLGPLLLATLDAEADEAEWETLRWLAEAAGDGPAVARLEAWERPLRDAERRAARAGRWALPIRRGFVVGRALRGAVSSAP